MLKYLYKVGESKSNANKSNVSETDNAVVKNVGKKSSIEVNNNNIFNTVITVVENDGEKKSGEEVISAVVEKPLKLDCFEKLNNIGRKRIRCSTCFNNPDTVKKFNNNKLCALATECGTIPRKDVLASHLKSQIHENCKKAEEMKNLTLVEKEKKVPVHRMIAKQNLVLAKKVGRFICSVYNDAKHGTLSAWSWPSREVADLKGRALDFMSDEHETFLPKEGQLQYVNPTAHKEFLECIVKADIGNLKAKLKNCLAISLRLDGSVDRTQVDNVHVMVKAVTEAGDSELIFLGFEGSRI